MNKIEGIRGFITFIVVLLIFFSLGLTVKFLLSNRNVSTNTGAVIENTPVNIPEDAFLNTPAVSEDPITLEGFKEALKSYDERYDLNGDGVVNTYDYYIFDSTIK